MKLLLVICCLLSLTGCGPGQKAPSKGFFVDLADATASPGDSHLLVAIAMGQQKANLNMEEKPTIAAAVLRIREVMQYRAEKIVFVRARRDVSWGEFMQMVDQVWPEAQVVSLVTAPVQSQAAKTYTLNPSCRDCRKFGGFQSR